MLPEVITSGNLNVTFKAQEVFPDGPLSLSAYKEGMCVSSSLLYPGPITSCIWHLVWEWVGWDSNFKTDVDKLESAERRETRTGENQGNHVI